MTEASPIRSSPWLPALVLATMVFSSGWAQQPPEGAAEVGEADVDGEALDINVDRRSLIAAGEAPDLFLLYTGDVIGYLDPCG